jgi:hypothetical protein
MREANPAGKIHQFWLFRVKFPGMKIEDSRPVKYVLFNQPPLNNPIRKKAKITPTREWHVDL